MDAKKLFTPPYHFSSTQSEYLLSKDSWSSMAVIHKSSCEISTASKSLPGKINECFGFIGFFHLQHASYLCYIKEAKYVGSLSEASIFLISEVEFLPMTSIKDQESLASLREFISKSYFYFSYTLNLTNSLSRVLQFRDPMTLDSSDQRFCWNFKHQQEFVKGKVLELVLPVISGFVQIEHVSVEGQTVDFGIVTRRDLRRAGTRYHTRGLDSTGHAANFAETEQIVAWNDSGKYFVQSFVQIRGSIPLLWTQSPDLTWNPKVKILADITPGQKHDRELIKFYENIVYVNLVDKKGTQKRLGDKFSELITTRSTSQYIWYDFHKECKNMKYENLSKLIEEVSSFIEEHSWTEIEVEKNKQIHEGVRKKSQSGVLRTNCVDCLDRTGVVQSVFARVILHKQLLSLGHRVSDPMGLFSGDLESCFRNFWANNTDIISLLYSGTKAMKTDYTRTGKRTIRGSLQDSKYGLTRYFINNFYDGSRKNQVDLFLGNMRLNKGKNNESKVKLFTFLVLIVIACISAQTIAGKVIAGYGQIVMCLGFLYLFYKLILPVVGRRIAEKPLIA
jgi:hypothetical protein